MTLISRKSADLFMVRRIIRIVPIYWFATLAFFFIEICTFSGSHAVAWWNYQDNSTALLKSLLFIPYLNDAGNMHPLLPVGWTLNLEMFYYLLFYIALKIHEKYAPILTLAALTALWTATPNSPTLAFYAGSYTLHFCFGIIAYYLCDFLSGRMSAKWAVPLAVITIGYAVFYVAYHVDPSVSAALNRVVAWLLPAGLIVLALLLHSASLRLIWRPLLALGDASYSLYLVHLIVLQQWAMLFAGVPLLDFKQSLFGAAAACAAAVGVSLAMFYLLERPVTKSLNHWLHRSFGGNGAQAARLTRNGIQSRSR